MAYDRLDPIGAWRSDFQFASLSSLMLNIAIKKWGKEGAQETTPLDFMPKWGETEQDQEQDIAAKIKQVFGSIGKKQK